MYSQRQDSIETFYYPNYNTYLYFYRYDVACLYASSVKNAKVINVSWHFFNDFLFYDTNYFQGVNSYLLKEKEILDNGTSIVRAAGN